MRKTNFIEYTGTNRVILLITTAVDMVVPVAMIGLMALFVIGFAMALDVAL